MLILVERRDGMSVYHTNSILILSSSTEPKYAKLKLFPLYDSSEGRSRDSELLYPTFQFQRIVEVVWFHLNHLAFIAGVARNSIRSQLYGPELVQI